MFGVLSFLMIVERFTFLISEFGTHLVSVKRIATKPKCLRPIINSTTLLIRFLVWFLIFCLSISFVYLEYRSYLLLTTLFSLLGLIRVLIPEWYYQGVQDLKIISLLSFCSRLISSLIIVVFVRGEQHLNIIPISYILADLCVLSFSLRHLLANKEISFEINNSSYYRYVKLYFVYSFGFFLSKISAYFYTWGVGGIIGVILGSHQLGLYSSCERLYKALQSMTYPIVTIIYPYNAKHGISGKYYLLLMLTFLGGGGFFVSSFFFSKEIIMLIYGEKFLDASDLLTIFSLIFIVQSVSSMIGHPLLSVKGHHKVVNRSVLYGFFVFTLAISILYFSGMITIVNMTLCLLLCEFTVLVIRIVNVVKLRQSIL
ncbi:oligosaccharide flippase family protein [Vibrio alginolyticus]